MHILLSLGKIHRREKNEVWLTKEHILHNSGTEKVPDSFPTFRA
jgi:hypothetical protein